MNRAIQTCFWEKFHTKSLGYTIKLSSLLAVQIISNADNDKMHLVQ